MVTPVEIDMRPVNCNKEGVVVAGLIIPRPRKPVINEGVVSDRKP
jgi:hypothetical protein